MNVSYAHSTSAEPCLPSAGWGGKTNEDAFEELFAQNYVRVQKFFAHNGVAPEECRDLAQDTFLKVYSRLQTFRGESNPRTWLYRIALNHLLNARRSRATRKREGHEISLDVWLEAGPVPVASARRGEADPLDEVLTGELSRRLRQAVGELPPQMRRCVLLRVYHDLRYREIAEVLGVSIDTVKAHLYQARQTLKGKLADLCDLED